MPSNPTPAEDPSAPIHRGDLFWIEPSQLTGGAQCEVHPYVVVQDDVFNRSRIATVVVCGLTSNLHRASEPGNVLLDAGEGGLPKRSVVVVAQVSSVEKSALGARIGGLSQERVEQILAGLRFQQASFFERYAAANGLDFYMCSRSSAARASMKGHSREKISGSSRPNAVVSDSSESDTCCQPGYRSSRSAGGHPPGNLSIAVRSAAAAFVAPTASSAGTVSAAWLPAEL